MPAYLAGIRIDWHYDQLTDALKTVASDAHAELDSTDHTLRTFVEVLGRTAKAHPELVVDALVDGGYRQYHLIRAAHGQVIERAVEERPEDAPASAIVLPYDEVAGVALVRDEETIRALVEQHADDETFEGADGEVDLPLRYTSEEGLRAVAAAVARAIEVPAPSFVAEVDRERFLVEIAPGAARVRRLVVTGESRGLVAHLLHGELAVPAASKVARDPVAKYELPLFWPEPLLELMTVTATRNDRSLSYIAQLAWKTAVAEISKSDREALSRRLRLHLDAPKAKQTLFFPGAMADQIEAEAARLDASSSFVVQSAVVLARAVLVALPAR